MSASNYPGVPEAIGQLERYIVVGELDVAIARMRALAEHAGMGQVFSEFFLEQARILASLRDDAHKKIREHWSKDAESLVKTLIEAKDIKR